MDPPTDKKRAVAVIQARLGSSRLPRKVLEPLAGKPVLEWVVGRVRRAVRLDDVVVATTECTADEEIAAFCQRLGVKCFRGSENDVLDRFVQAARWAEASDVVRVNADNPLVDARYIDGLLAESGAWDYISYETSDQRPVMLTALSFFTELVTRECLERAGQEITDIRLREHVTLGVYRNPEQFRVKFLAVPSFAENQQLRLTLDTAEDLALLREVVGALGHDPQDASAESIVAEVSRRPEWLDRMEQLNNQNRKG